MGISSLAPSESWLHPPSAHPAEVEQMMGEIILRVMAWRPRRSWSRSNAAWRWGVGGRRKKAGTRDGPGL